MIDVEVIKNIINDLRLELEAMEKKVKDCISDITYDLDCLENKVDKLEKEDE